VLHSDRIRFTDEGLVVVFWVSNLCSDAVTEYYDPQALRYVLPQEIIATAHCDHEEGIKLSLVFV